MVKSNLTPAEKQACYQKQNASKIKEWDVQREKAQRAALKEHPKQWQEYRARKNERICLLWLKKKNQITAKQNTDFPRSSAADLAYRHYKTLQALVKAVS